MLINSGVKRIVCYDGYPDLLAKAMLDEAHLIVETMEPKDAP